MIFAVDDVSWATYVLVVYSVIFAIVGALVLYFPGTVAMQAGRRGYSRMVWFIASVVSLNPLLILVVLTALPDRKRVRQRDEERKKLQAKLLGRTAALPTPPTRSVALTSLGDQSTAAPPLHSLGDEETRG